ncbi:MAG TPA: PAS domain S-box protein [Terracidiphilus sp.]|nr:PAS domain S-box protein [Terracidiphilus sp.]
MMNPPKTLVETLESLYIYFDNLGQGIAVLDREGTLVSLNRTAARLLGLPHREQAQGRFEELADAFAPFGEKIPPEERPSRLAVLGRFVRNYEAALWSQGAAEAAFVEISTAPIPDADGETSHILVSYREISQQRRLDEARARLAAIVESSEDAIIGKDLTGTVTAWNKGAEKLFGYAAGEIIGQSIRKLLLPGDEAEEDEILRRISQGETIQHSERKRRKKSGEVIEVSVTISPIRNSRGEIVGASKIARDITQSRRTSEALRESQQRLTGIIDSAMDAIITVDEQQRVVLFNAAAERMFLCSQAGALGKPIDQFIPERFRALHSRHIRNFADTGMTSRAMGELGSLWALRSDGEEFQIEASISQVEWQGRKLFTVILRDVTERKRAEEHARQSEEKFAKAFKSSPIAIAITTRGDGRYVDANEALLKMLGYEENEVVGHSVTELDLWADREQRAEVLEKLKQNGNVRSLQVPLKVKSGAERIVSLSMEAIVLDGVDCILTTMFDMSETRNLERQLAQSQKMEAVGQLTGGIAHDFNNLLGVVVGNLDLLERQVAWNEVAVKRVQAALRAAGRGAELTRRLLAFSRREQLNPAPVAIEAVIHDLVELAKRTMGPEIRIATRCDEEMPPVFVDAAGLETALLNLALNARDAMPKGGSLVFSAHLADLSGGNALVQAAELAPGKYARIAVSDSGSGMSRETLDRAFEPFFTTKPRDKGTGLGLAMVYGFIKQSGGAIRLYSEVGYGTTVSIYLPLAAQPAGGEANPLQLPPVLSGERLGGTALVVDDEADLLDIADAYLAELGYTVIRAEDAATALAVLERTPEIDLLLTDIIMPGELNGFELAEKVRKMRPEIRIIFTSGFPAEALAERSGKLEGGPLLHKPYLRAEFADMVRKSMTANSTANPIASPGKH